jgi:hypothetical protein
MWSLVHFFDCFSFFCFRLGIALVWNDYALWRRDPFLCGFVLAVSIVIMQRPVFDDCVFIHLILCYRSIKRIFYREKGWCCYGKNSIYLFQKTPMFSLSLFSFTVLEIVQFLEQVLRHIKLRWTSNRAVRPKRITYDYRIIIWNFVHIAFIAQLVRAPV